MKKPYIYFKLSKKHKCIICGKGIKKNLLYRKAGIPMLCYYHFKLKKKMKGLNHV